MTTGQCSAARVRPCRYGLSRRTPAGPATFRSKHLWIHTQISYRIHRQHHTSFTPSNLLQLLLQSCQHRHRHRLQVAASRSSGKEDPASGTASPHHSNTMAASTANNTRHTVLHLQKAPQHPADKRAQKLATGINAHGRALAARRTQLAHQRWQQRFQQIKANKEHQQPAHQRPQTAMKPRQQGQPAAKIAMASKNTLASDACVPPR
jgi:hypothetical protein